jgi:hypothetical protein
MKVQKFLEEIQKNPSSNLETIADELNLTHNAGTAAKIAGLVVKKDGKNYFKYPFRAPKKWEAEYLMEVLREYSNMANKRALKKKEKTG